MTSLLHEKCPNTGKYGAKKTPYLETYHGVLSSSRFTIASGPKSQEGQFYWPF